MHFQWSSIQNRIGRLFDNLNFVHLLLLMNESCLCLTLFHTFGATECIVLACVAFKLQKMLKSAERSGCFCLMQIHHVAIANSNFVQPSFLMNESHSDLASWHTFWVTEGCLHFFCSAPCTLLNPLAPLCPCALAAAPQEQLSSARHTKDSQRSHHAASQEAAVSTPPFKRWQHSRVSELAAIRGVIWQILCLKPSRFSCGLVLWGSVSGSLCQKSSFVGTQGDEVLWTKILNLCAVLGEWHSGDACLSLPKLLAAAKEDRFDTSVAAVTIILLSLPFSSSFSLLFPLGLGQFCWCESIGNLWHCCMSSSPVTSLLHVGAKQSFWSEKCSTWQDGMCPHFRSCVDAQCSMSASFHPILHAKQKCFHADSIPIHDMKTVRAKMSAESADHGEFPHQHKCNCSWWIHLSARLPRM